MNQPETKVQRSGKQITPIKKKKSSNIDAKVISSPEIIVSKPETIISGFDTIVSGFEIRNRSGHESLYILTKITFIPTRRQNISNRYQSVKVPGKVLPETLLAGVGIPARLKKIYFSSSRFGMGERYIKGAFSK